jgi:hypothetical protein
MPRPDALQEIEISFDGGYFPSAPDLPPTALQRTAKAGNNVWLRPMGKVEVAKGISQVSATNAGARLCAVDIKRASIAGGLVSGRLPYAGILRYLRAVLFYVSELTSQQVYLDETAVSGLTTSATAGGLRIGVPDGIGGYNVYDAGFDPPSLPPGNVTVGAGGTKNMNGSTGVALCAWRSTTNAISAPSNVVYNAFTPSSADLAKVVLPSAASGQDGWIFAGTRWGDQSGDVRIVRFVYIVPRGTFTATNGSPNLTAGAGTFFLQDLRPGDVVTISGGSYTIATVTSQTTATLTANFTGSTGAGKTATITTAAADWYNGELGSLLSRDVFKPPKAAGVFQFANRVFLWGTRGESSSAVTGSAITPTLDDNPEHVGLFNIVTASGSDLVNVLVGDRQLFLMTTTSLESVTFTGQTDVPYVIRVLGEPGFKSAANGVVYKDFFYGYSNKPLRTRTDDNIDVMFAAPAWKDMQNWNAQRVVLAIDPKNEAVLFCQYDGATNTIIIPWMTQLGQWGPPHTISGQVTDFCVVQGECYLMLLSGGNYRVQLWEGGAGASNAYIASQYYAIGGVGVRKRIKGFIFTGKGTTLQAFIAKQNAAIPDVTNTGEVAASYTLTGADRTESNIFTHLEGRALAVRVDFPTDGSLQQVVAQGMPLTERR